MMLFLHIVHLHSTSKFLNIIVMCDWSQLKKGIFLQFESTNK